MAISIEMTWGENVTFGELEQFIAHAKAGGASAGTVVESVTSEGDPTVQLGWRVAADGQTTETATVPMPHKLMWQIESLLEQFASGDGDIRSDQDEASDYASRLRDALVEQATY